MSNEKNNWNDRLFRREYERQRKEKIREQLKKDDPNFSYRPNFNKVKKEEILNQLINQIKNGQEPNHEYFKLSVVYKDEVKRRK